MYSLTSTWTIKQGKDKAATTALRRLAQKVHKHEADTLIYLVHVPDMREKSLPTPSNLEVVFFEVYRNKAAFTAHVNGPVFTGFVEKHGHLFLSTTVDCGDGGKLNKPFTTVEFLQRKAGFIRREALGTATA